RLIRSRLRQHVFLKVNEIEKRRKNSEDVYDLVLDSEKDIEVASIAAWGTTLELWTAQELRRDGLNPLRACVMHGLAEAVERSSGFIVEKEVEYEYENVHEWV